MIRRASSACPRQKNTVSPMLLTSRSMYVEMRYKPESKVLVFVTRKMIKEWCERQVPRKVLGDSHLKNLDNWLKKIGRYANIHL